MSVNYVHQDLIHNENVKKELYYRKMHKCNPPKIFGFLPDQTLSNSPAEEMADRDLAETSSSRSIYAMPPTENGQYGWITTTRFQNRTNFGRVHTHITEYAEDAWRRHIKPF